MGLTCSDKKLVGALGGAYFAGFGVSAGVLPPLSDAYGRRVPFFLFILVQTIAYAAIFRCSDVYGAIACYAVVGLCAGGRVTVGTQFLNEVVPSAYGTFVTTLWNTVDSGVMIV